MGKFIDLIKEDGWEFIAGPGGVTSHIVQAIAVTEDNELVLVKQKRVPVGQYTLELPGGRCEKDSYPALDAYRELQEETGYTLADGEYMQLATVTAPLAAIFKELCAFFYFPKVIKTAEGGGLAHEGESTEVILVKLDRVNGLNLGISDESLVDPKVYLALQYLGGL